MNIEQIAIRFTDHPHPTPGDIPIDHARRQPWWLPIIGPMATCLLNHLAPQSSDDDSHLTPARTLAATIGLGKGTGKHSPLIRSLDRLTRFGFGHFDIESSEQSDPCITLYRTVGLPAPRLTKNWPDDMQQAHALELAEMYHQAGQTTKGRYLVVPPPLAFRGRAGLSAPPSVTSVPSRPAIEEVGSLHRYFIQADRMRVHFDQLIRDRGAAVLDDDDWVEQQIYSSLWYGSLFVVIEGWNKLELHDDAVDRLVGSTEGLDMLELLRRFRNGVFHYQPKYWDPRFTDLWSLDMDSARWIREVNSALGRAFLTHLSEPGS